MKRSEQWQMVLDERRAAGERDREALVEDVEFMLDTGCTEAVFIIQRLQRAGRDMSYASLTTALRRQQRSDLTARFTHEIHLSEMAA